MPCMIVVVCVPLGMAVTISNKKVCTLHSFLMYYRVRVERCLSYDMIARPYMKCITLMFLYRTRSGKEGI